MLMPLSRKTVKTPAKELKIARQRLKEVQTDADA
jgi:phage-related protein